jgi:hypothetical protein
MLGDALNETLSFVKADGTNRKDGIKGLVTSGKVMTEDTSIQVQPNDRFLREIGNGLVEEYIVEDPGYSAAMPNMGVGAFYNSKVRRSDAPPAPPSTIINNVQGANARVNINSVDNSQNLAAVADDGIFDLLREKLSESDVPKPDQKSIQAAIDDMQQAQGTPDFKEKYQGFVAVAANHASIFGTLLSGLAMLL